MRRPGELLYRYNIVKPKYVMPVHGEWRHLKANAEIAIQAGVPRDNAFIIENGIVVISSTTKLRSWDRFHVDLCM
jgi:mRNA degradation ribonuclease J1/J2